MGSYVFDDLPDPHQTPQKVWAAVIAKDVSDIGERAQIIIPALDTKLRWSNCRWQSRNDLDLPGRGMDCLAIFDDNNEIWIPVWWPF